MLTYAPLREVKAWQILISPGAGAEKFDDVPDCTVAGIGTPDPASLLADGVGWAEGKADEAADRAGTPSSCMSPLLPTKVAFRVMFPVGLWKVDNSRES